ncbi:MAG TPA: ribonuclease D [Tepidisphaeraceae bacterium]|nr:ribonuclease D [Tepidisphaeraceae bacterium]
MDREEPASRPPAKPFNFRAQHRARAHESAHAQPAAADEANAAIALAGIFRGPPEMIISDEQLAHLIANLRTDGSFAYDSEFIGELTYHPQLCVLQVASRNRVALIDPLAQIDLIPFWELLADPAVEKIVHAGDQDIEPVVRHLNRAAANVFDTQIAAGFVGLPYPLSLSKLVAELTGARLGKGLTFSHWDQRPLSAIQLRYAADDVRYLPAAAAELYRRLEALGHTAWAKEECAGVCDPKLYHFDPDTQYLRVRGANSLQPRNAAVLRELTIWRDGAARRHDVPPRSFLRDEVLLDLARNPAKSVEQLSRVRGLPRPVEHEYGNDIVEATARAMTLPPIHMPASRDPEAAPRERFRADAVFATAQCLCAGLSLDPALVASRQEVSEFHRYITDGAGDPPKMLMGWRKQAVGDELSEILAGNRKMGLEWSKGELRASIEK